METVKSNLPKKDYKRMFYHFFLIVLGSLLLAFGTAIFLTKNTIVAGGLSGIGFIIQKLVPADFGNIIDICIWVLTALLWFLSLFTLGKDFALKTLVASILYPLFYTIFYRVPVFIELADAVSSMGGGPATTGDLILNALFGGITIGLGVAVTFVGKGSTGGVDVIAMLLKKYLGLNVSIGSFIIDGAIIVVAIFALEFPNYIINCLAGIIAAFMTALVIQFVYSRRENSLIMEVISDHWEEISEFIQVKMERGVTLIDITGGYTDQKRVLLRSVLTKEEYIEIKEFVSSIDQTAFVTFTSTNAVFGEGFKDHDSKLISKNKAKRKTKVKKNNEDING